jgi:hypothetical protein
LACALNLEAKLRETLLDGIPAMDLIKRIEGTSNIQGDRIFAWVDKDMPNLVEKEIDRNRDSFDKIPEWANKMNHKGFPISFKQRVPFGSLQLSFASQPVNGLLAADIDIDLYYGLGHIGEVFRNQVTDNPTDPFTVYTQLFDQRLFPLYLMMV